ncbi:hypothetical protein AC1031_012066 [Aphanomyces cochlioides]|nr:hypothetical protein AC1031_012066 [Aphanomyces cochlioides]
MVCPGNDQLANLAQTLGAKERKNPLERCNEVDHDHRNHAHGDHYAHGGHGDYPDVSNTLVVLTNKMKSLTSHHHVGFGEGLIDFVIEVVFTAHGSKRWQERTVQQMDVAVATTRCWKECD